MTSKTIFIDESGNFGKSGRYFTISGVVFDDELKTNEIKKAKSRIGDAKKNNSTCVSLNGELKANSMAYEERKKLLNRLNNLNFEINYITLDLNHMYVIFKQESKYIL